MTITKRISRKRKFQSLSFLIFMHLTLQICIMFYYFITKCNHVGPGEQGSGFTVPQYDGYKEDFKKEGMNIRASDGIALDRSLHEVRSSR